MRTPQEMVREFHRAFGVPNFSTPGLPTTKRQYLRVRLLEEEMRETKEAIGNSDIVGIADGLADLVVVIYGTALEYGIDLDAVLAEVHKSNMSKLAADGRPIFREDGKILKPKGWKHPDIAKVIFKESGV